MVFAMDAFCGKPFWDLNLTWFTGHDRTPDFTPCFEETVLAWIPCAFLWIFGLLSICTSWTSHAKPIPWNPLSVAKCFGTIILVVVQCAQLCRRIYAAHISTSTVYPVEYFTPALRVASYVFVIILIVYNRLKGVRSSGVLFNFWFLSSVCQVFAFRTQILNSTNPNVAEDSFGFVIEMILYPLVLAQLLLNCWADAAPKFAAPSELEPCPEETSSYLSKLIFSWFDALAITGYKKPLEYSDLWDLNHEEKSSSLFPVFDRYWQRAKTKASAPGKAAHVIKDEEANSLPPQNKKEVEQVSIFPVLVRQFGPSFMFGSFLKVFQDICMFVSPQILSLLIDFVSGDEEDWKGYFYASILFATAVAQTLFLAQYFHRMFLIGIRVKTTLVSVIYRKALVLSNSARNSSTVGEIVNLMSVDAQRIQDVIPYSSFVWSGPFQISLSLYFLWQSLGPCVLAGLGLMILMIPINSFIASRLEKLQIVQMKYKDERVKLMNELLTGMKVLKLYAWENSFEKQVLNIRDKELKILRTIALLNSSVGFLWQCTPFLVALVTFGTYVLIDEANILTPQKAFVSLTLFNILSMPLAMFPMVISSLVQARVSLKRLNRFMNSEEIDQSAVTHDTNEPNPIMIRNGIFSWSADTVALRNINLNIKEGSLCAVVGEVGCGKSSLLSAVLGEMYKKSGQVNTKGEIAYVGQQAWIQNATVKDNVLFGSRLDLHKYDKIIEACALKPDLQILPAGDKTEIGEKGINLSGGQKQRISLARAAYNNADVYLLDDPLSAVDSHVGKHIFENVIGPKGILKKKTRVLVTHGITYLPEVDFIIVMSGGQITESGSYQELLDKKGAFSEFIAHHLEQDEEGNEESREVEDVAELTGSNPRDIFVRQRSRVSESDSIGENSIRRQSSVTSKDDSMPSLRKTSTGGLSQKQLEAIQEGEVLIQAEKAETGSVNWKIYIHYAKSVGLPNVAVVLLFYAIFESFSLGSNLWLSAWSNEEPTINGTQDIGRRDMYLGVYGALGVGQVVTIFVASVTLALGLLKASAILHSDMLKRIMRAPSWFFDTTPTGRIVNRFAKDVDACDLLLPDCFRDFLMCFYVVLSTIVVISYSTPPFLLVILPIGVIYYLVQRFYVATSRQLKRLESVSRSPIYSHFTETITGCMTIRAFGVEERFILESDTKVDYNQRAYFPSIVSNRWLAVRLETIGNFIILFASLFAIIGRRSLTPGLVGLSVSYALQITQYLNWMVRMTSSVETNIVGVERIREYTNVDQEAPAEIDNGKPNEAWPDKGQILFDNYQTRYREGLDLVLRAVSAKIEPAEKIGIIGRTGSGKSSLALALFRLLEPAGGTIMIDGKNTSTLGLHDLRSRLTIIPQDPVLFSGSLRMNLDPFNKYSDEDIWRALEFAHLKAFAKELPYGLNYEISECGQNLSVGQRQLVCLARALLRKSKILVLDEATAQVDLGTDELIQETIRSEFKDSTVLTIAHRLNTIMDSTRVMVLDRGEIREFDKPDVLLKNRNSLFYKMAKDAGIVS